MRNTITARPGATRVDPISAAAALAAGKKVPPDAIELLMQDHREVEGLFRAYRGTESIGAKARLAKRICFDLKLHTEIEEQIFYSAVRIATRDVEIIDDAMKEHAEAKVIIEEIERQASDSTVDELIDQLEQAIKHHVEEEECVIFPKTRDTRLDLYTVGRQMAGHRAERAMELAGKSPPSVAEHKPAADGVYGRQPIRDPLEDRP